MNTISQLENILTHFEKCPLNVFRVELEMFLNTLKADIHLTTILTEIVNSNEQALGSKVASLVENIQTSTWADLSFANSASLRAAVGYKACQCLLGSYPKPLDCGKQVVQIGNFYGHYQGEKGELPESNAINIFSEILLHPLVSYLRSSMEIRHRVLILLSRYRQRSEWFTDKEQIKVILESGKNIENKLKRDFLRYLFDNGIDFSVESEVPPGGGEVDVLAVLPEFGPLPIEVKVFDGEKRNASYITGGIAQTADYARKFNSPEAYYIVYNVAEDTKLSLPGISTGFNVVSIQLTPVTIHSISIDLRKTLPASQAKNQKTVNIPLP